MKCKQAINTQLEQDGARGARVARVHGRARPAHLLRRRVHGRPGAGGVLRRRLAAARHVAGPGDARRLPLVALQCAAPPPRTAGPSARFRTRR